MSFMCGVIEVKGVPEFKHFVDDELHAVDGNGLFDVHRPYDRKLYAHASPGGREGGASREGALAWSHGL
jgi:hypothetical protein